MAHFAQLDSTNTVIQVIVVNNEKIIDENGIESEELGIRVCRNIYGSDTNWKQTSYTDSMRTRYAGIDFTYNEEHDAFIPPKQYPSWVLNTTSLLWEAPVQYPDDGNYYYWDEDTLSWVQLPEETEE